jgi:hypothetical protein
MGTMKVILWDGIVLFGNQSSSSLVFFLHFFHFFLSMNVVDERDICFVGEPNKL